VLLILFVIKPIIETLKAPVIKKVPEVAMPAAPPPMPGAEIAPEEVIKEEVTEMIKKEPRRAATILKEWLSE